jgi:diguanylate cyclase (GGDEF)-like protein/PAS domain S-box-containing protein
MARLEQRATPLALVVDDEDLVRRLVREALEQSGFEVCEAENGARALEQFDARRPDIVVLDIMMPVMDGFVACSRLRSSMGGRRVPVLIMTGLDDADSIASAYEHGATDYITKPLSVTDLIHRVRYMLRGSSATEALLRSEARLELAQRIAKIGNWEWHPQSNRFRASSELCRLMGIRADEFGGTLESFLQIVQADDRTRVGQVIRDIAENRSPCDIDHRLVLPNGAEFTVNLQAEGVFDEQLRSLVIVGTAQDISERKRSEREIQRLAYFDSLTGLPNRMLFKDRLAQAVSYARRYRTTLATMFLDLDRFKAINDTLGHNIGDMLLKSVADRLMESVRYSDSIGRPGEQEPTHELARLGGDEFTVLLTNVHDVQDAGKVARRMLEALAKPFLINGREIFVTVSIGIASFPADGDSVDQLLEHADSAMYHAKEKGRNNYQFYSDTMNTAENDRVKFESELRQGTEREEFVVYYQPQVDLRTSRIVGAEALVRWQHPQRGLLEPSAFLTAAAETGLIRAIDEWMLRAVCRQSLAWRQHGLLPTRISMNVSNSLFHGNTMVKAVEDALRDTGLDPGCLELELTESVAMRNVDVSIALLCRLQAIGVQVSIDDFGTGYSSLSCLQRLPVNMVKIDQSIIRAISTQSQPVPILRAIIAMAHSLQLQVMAEGVEQEVQQKILLAEGCDQAQGYLFGRPMPADEFAKLLPPLPLSNAS